jgi:hypothetical protein
MKMKRKAGVYEIKEKLTEYLPNILHGTGAALSLVSGIPSLPYAPGYSFNVAVTGLLGYETLPSKIPNDYTPSSRYDDLVGLMRKYSSSRNVKALFSGALTAMSAWFALQGNTEAAIGNGLFDLGLMLSVAGSEIEKRRASKKLKELEKELATDTQVK